MKKIEKSKKLVVSRESVRNLSEVQMAEVGGASGYCPINDMYTVYVSCKKGNSGAAN